MNYKAKYSNLFKEGKIRKQTIKNRIVVTPVGLTYADSNGQAGLRLIRYLEERAKGGAGIVMPGIVLVDSKTGKINANELCLENQAQSMSFAHLARAIHKYDAKLFLQLYHPGKCTVSGNLNGEKPWSASEVPTADGKQTKAMSKKDIEYLIEKFVQSAKLAETAGVDGVEIHAAHGYLLNQFLSPLYNHRSDEYGGSIENRARIVVEIYEAIRKVVSKDFVVGIRISVDEFVEGGNTLEDGLAFAKIWDEMGVDYMNVNCGLQESSQFNREPPCYPQGWKKHLSKSVKEAVSCPIIAVNTIKKPDFADSLIGEGVCDFAGLSRGHLADPYWTKKITQGKEDQIRICISCLNCMDTFIQGIPPTCTVNPRLGREIEFSQIQKNGRGRTVVVIGGGPGGMEAAMVLAERKFRVVLFEQKAELGGQLNYAEKPPKKEKIRWLKEGMIAQLKSLGVEVRLNTKADIEAVKKLKPLGVFLCSGAQPVKPETIDGIDRKNVYTVPEVLSGAVDLRKKQVIVAGAGQAGLETASFLADQGCHVKIIEQESEIGKGVFKQCLNEELKELKAADAEIYPDCTLRSIEETYIMVSCEGQADKKMEAEAVVMSLGVKGDPKAAEEFKSHFTHVRIVGDALKSGRIVDAITDGFTKAWVFDEE